jgi:hypothetical protein
MNQRFAKLLVKHCKITGEENYLKIEVPLYQPEEHLISHGYSFNVPERIWYKYE